MKKNVVGDFSKRILNTSDIRSIIKKFIGPIADIESLDSIQDLELIELNIGEQNPFFTLSYSGIGTDKSYPDMLSKVIDPLKEKRYSGLSVITSEKGNEGKTNEFEYARLGLQNGYMQIGLKIYNPEKYSKFG